MPTISAGALQIFVAEPGGESGNGPQEEGGGGMCALFDGLRHVLHVVRAVGADDRVQDVVRRDPEDDGHAIVLLADRRARRVVDRAVLDDLIVRHGDNQRVLKVRLLQLGGEFRREAGHRSDRVDNAGDIEAVHVNRRGTHRDHRNALLDSAQWWRPARSGRSRRR